MCIILVFCDMKGGVSKTTSAVCTTTRLTDMGYKVLCVDTDPQANATSAFNARIDGVETLANVYITNTPIEECIQHTPFGDVLAGDPLLEITAYEKAANIKLTERDKEYPNWEGRMVDEINRIKDQYDYIIIDTAPRGNGYVFRDAIRCADYIIIPVICTVFAQQGVTQMNDSLEMWKEWNPNINILGLLITCYELPETNLARATMSSFITAAAFMKTKVFDTVIRKCVKVGESQAYRDSLFKRYPKCTAAKDYIDFVDELLNEIKIKESRK